jgi:hypothetical protein
MKINFYHHTKQFSKSKYKNLYDEIILNKFFKPKLNFYYFKNQILPFLIYIAIVLCLFLIDKFRCSMIYWIDRQHLKRTIDKGITSCNIPNKYLTDESKNKYIIDNQEYNSADFFEMYIFFDLIRNIINFGEFTVYIYLIYLTNRYPRKNDNFLMFKEYIYVLFILFIFNDIFPFIYYFISYDKLFDFMNNSLRIFCLILVFTFCNYKRYYQRIEHIRILISDFDNFMNFPPFYNYLYNYIKKNQDYDIKFLDFWINYHILDNKIYEKNKLEEKMQYSNNSKSNKTWCEDSNYENEMKKSRVNQTNSKKNIQIHELEKKIKEKINNMFEKYYDNYENDYNNYNEGNIIDPLNEFKIDFPIDMQEKVEEYVVKNLEIKEIKDIFEESYNFVCYHLSNIHYDIINKENDYLHKILFVTNYFEMDKNK